MSSYLLIVSLYVAEGRETQYRAFEDQALAIGARYEVRLVAAARLSAQANGLAAPYELHVLSLPRRAALEQWRQDPQYQAMMAERAAIILRTEVIEGDECTQLVLADMTGTH